MPYNWRTLTVVFALLVLAGVLFHARNAHRFVHVGDANYVLDTRTGQYCSPWPTSRTDLPRCSDLAKSWH